MSDSPLYMDAIESVTAGAWALLGVPYDETCCFRKGAAKGPNAIRDVSDGLEDYCPIADRILADTGFADLGNLTLPDKTPEKVAEVVANETGQILNAGGKPLLLGGEHGISLGAIRTLADTYPDLCVVQFDAHADLRESYSDTPFSHACVMRRAIEIVGPDQIFQLGIRSGTQDEWEWMREQGSVYPADADAVQTILERIGDRPIYITLDLDVLDPSVMPGTGTPEPGGLSFNELDSLIRMFASSHVVAADVVELAPELDPTGVSSIVAAKIVRTILLSL